MHDDVLAAHRYSSFSEMGEVVQPRGAGALFQGDYSTSVTVGDEFDGSRLGLGVMHDLEGEVVSLNGVTWAIPVDGQPRVVASHEGIAFGIAARGGVQHKVAVNAGVSLENLIHVVDAYLEIAHVDHEQVVCAIEIVGTFTDVVLRTVAAPTYAHEPLAEVIDHETRFPFDVWSGSLVGFRFPDTTSADLIPGLHLHAIAQDTNSGGHVRAATTGKVVMHLWVDELHPWKSGLATSPGC